MPQKEEKFLGLKLPLIRFRSRTTFLLFKAGVALFVILLVLFIMSRNSTGRLGSYFNRKCVNYKQRDYSRRLNDRLPDYASAARSSGIVPCKTDEDIKKRVSTGKLVKVSSGKNYIIDRLTHSSPYLTRDANEVLNEISRRFRKKTSDKGLYKARFIITSMTRKTESIRLLRRNNSNASVNSPHQYGNAFDISYKRFTVRKLVMTNCDHSFMKEVLAEIIYEMRKEGKCWATYERNQGCFHVVAR